jgi:hypothetical protein
MGNIRNALLSFQGWLQKIKLAWTNSIIVSLNQLKKNYENNTSEIFRLEKELTKIRDDDLSAKREIKVFEFLHNEKPSPLFLTLLKSSKQDSLNCIRDDFGNTFSTDERENPSS